MYRKTMIMQACLLMALFVLPALADTTIIKETTIATPVPVVPVPVVPVPVVPVPVVTGPPTTITTITTATTTAPGHPVPGSRIIHFEDFDINQDNLLTMPEIGEMLFKLYDTDGNQVIDNIEYERPAVLTVTPMAVTTRITYDFDNDGFGDKSVYTYETFMQRTQLARFDRNGNGLSPHEFTGQSFLVADVDNSKVIESREWQGTYIASIDDKNRADAALNK